jgi:hypothetical protein
MRLSFLWEEAAKLLAPAMPTGGFRHGRRRLSAPASASVCGSIRNACDLWDLALARDRRHHGTQVLLIGQDIPSIPAPWQFVVDISPIQIAAERLAHLGAQGCDSCRVCSHIVDEEGRLIPGNGGHSSEWPQKESAE